MRLTFRRRNANDISDLIFKREERYRFISLFTLSSSDEMQRNSGFIAFSENIARSLF
jgi:hypothetical protein